MSDTENKKKKAKYLLQDLDVREVSLVGRPAIDRTYLITKAVDDGEFTDDELDEYLDSNLAESVEKAATKREKGFDFPAAAFAYVPDASKPSTWKLRLWESPTAKVTARQVGMAVAALGKGFRGKKVQIPSGDLAKVKAKVRAAWNSVHGKGDELPAVLKEAGTVPAETGVNAMDEKLLELLKSVESEEIREALTGAFNTIIENKETVPEDIMKGFYELAGYELPTIEKEVEVVKEVEVEKIVEVEKPVEPPEEDIFKDADPKILELFKGEKAKREAAEAEVEKSKVEKAEAENARIAQEYVQKAEDWGELGFEKEALGPVLRAVNEKLSEDESKAVMKVFEQAKGVATLTKQDEEFGVAGGDEKGNSDEPKYEIKAKAMVEKGEAKTRQQAVAILARTEPELFDEE